MQPGSRSLFGFGAALLALLLVVAAMAWRGARMPAAPAATLASDRGSGRVPPASAEELAPQPAVVVTAPERPHAVPPPDADSSEATTAPTCKDSRERARWVIEGRLVGLSEAVPWRSPVFVLPRTGPRDARSGQARMWFETAHRRAPRDGDSGFREGGEWGVDPFAWNPAIETMPRLAQVGTDGDGHPPVHADVAADGSFILDLAAVVAGLRSDESLRGVELIANDPSYVPIRRPLDFDRRATDEGFTQSVTLSVSLAAVVTGRVDVRDGGSKRPMISGRVALLGGGTGTALVAPDCVALESDRFRLRAPSSGEFDVVVAASGFRPEARPVAATVGATTDVGTLWLDRGADITGRITWPPVDRGAADYAWRPMPVTAIDADCGGEGIDLPGIALVGSNGRFHWRQLTARSADPRLARADYVLAGLSPDHRYRVLLGELALANASDPSRSIVPATAPASGVDFVFDAAYVGVDVLTQWRAVAHAKVTAPVGGASPQQTDRMGRAGFLVPPFAVVPFTVEAEGFLPANGTVNAGPAGTLARAGVMLVPAPDAAELAVEVKCAELAVVRFGRLRFRSDKEGVTTSFARDVVADHDGRLVLDDLRPGRFIVSLELVSGEPTSHTTTAPAVNKTPPGTVERSCLFDGGFLRPASAAVELVLGQTAEAKLTAATGGVLRLTAHDSKGVALFPECTLADEHGQPVDFRFVDDDRTVRWGPSLEPFRARLVGTRTLATTRVQGDHPLRVESALAPGDYTLTLALDGFETTRVVATLVSGQVCELDVVLPRIP